MNKALTQNQKIISVLIIATALLHIVLAVASGDALFLFLFIGNGIGYLILLAFWLGRIPQLANFQQYAKLALMIFTSVTIIGYFAANGAASFDSYLGMGDKLIEIAALALIARE